MMSSFASVLVANANATPEKVVPCEVLCQQPRHSAHEGVRSVQNQCQRSTVPWIDLHLGLQQQLAYCCMLQEHEGQLEERLGVLHILLHSRQLQVVEAGSLAGLGEGIRPSVAEGSRQFQY